MNVIIKSMIMINYYQLDISWFKIVINRFWNNKLNRAAITKSFALYSLAAFFADVSLLIMHLFGSSPPNTINFNHLNFKHLNVKIKIREKYHLLVSHRKEMPISGVFSRSAPAESL